VPNAWFGGAGTACLAMCGQTSKISEQIIITTDRLQHVIDRHNFDSKFDNVSKFNKGENIVELIKSSVNQPTINQTKNVLQRTFDVGRNIGIDRATKMPTSILTVITNTSNKLITSFPGKP
jgi:hypothetical protein